MPVLRLYLSSLLSLCTTGEWEGCRFIPHFRAQRIHFEQNSPNGIILFREASKAVKAYSSQLIEVIKSNSGTALSPEKLYKERYKGN